MVNLIGATNEEPQGMIAKLGLNDWKFALPVGLLIGIPAVANEVLYIFNFTNLNFIAYFTTVNSKI